jgi:heat shock protein HslJ
VLADNLACATFDGFIPGTIIRRQAMSDSSISRRQFVVAASLIGAGLATPVLADEPDAPVMPTDASPEGKLDEFTLYREWLVEDVAGGGTLDRVPVTLLIKGSGQVSGSGGCNRYMGQASIDGDNITFGKLGSTMMACDEARMNLERKYHDTLAKVATWRIDQTQKKLFLADEAGTTVLVFAANG